MTIDRATGKFISNPKTEKEDIRFPKKFIGLSATPSSINIALTEPEKGSNKIIQEKATAITGATYGKSNIPLTTALPGKVFCIIWAANSPNIKAPAVPKNV